MTDKEIEKGLECCAEFLCGECPYQKFDHIDYKLQCIHMLIVDVANLYKRTVVDAVPVVHGRWIPSDIDIDEYEKCNVEDWYDWECSVCHYQMSYVDPVERRHLTNYCPNCGARMDG